MTDLLAGLEWLPADPEIAQPTATITRWADSDWPPLVRGQRVRAWDRDWRVAEVRQDHNGDQTYSLELAETVDAHEAACRCRGRGLGFYPEPCGLIGT